MTNKEAAYILSDKCHEYTVEELRTAFDLAIKALEGKQEEKEDSFDDAIQNLNDISDRLIRFIDDIINELKNSYEMPHGDWLWVGFHGNRLKWSCSLCGNGVEHQVSICPKCGAKMQMWC